MSQRCEVRSGPGLIARGTGVVWVGPDCDRGLAEVLVACAQLAGTGSLGILSAVAAHTSDGAGSFALAVPNGESWTGLWRGEGRVRDGEREIEGTRTGGSWLATSFGGNGHIAVGAPHPVAESAALAQLTDLIAGVVPGSGAALIYEPARQGEHGAAPASPAAPPASPTWAEQGPSARAAAVASATPEPEPEPAASEPEPSAPLAVATGPAAAESGDESTQMWSPPPAGHHLFFDDGHTLDVDGDLVLGRRPEQHDLVVKGGARPVSIEDSQNVLSSAHAAVQLRGTEAYLLDLGSLNGTHIAAATATEWTRLDAGVARRLEEGDRLLLGWTIITYATSAPS